MNHEETVQLLCKNRTKHSRLKMEKHLTKKMQKRFYNFLLDFLATNNSLPPLIAIFFRFWSTVQWDRDKSIPRKRKIFFSVYYIVELCIDCVIYHKFCRAVKKSLSNKLFRNPIGNLYFTQVFQTYCHLLTWLPYSSLI